MIILSQDENEIVNVENVLEIKCVNNDVQKEFIKKSGLDFDIFGPLINNVTGMNYKELKGFGIYAYFDNSNNTMLGQYSTKERAKEVLIEIMQNYYDSENYKYKNTFLNAGELNRLQEGLVYQMPKE